MATMGEAYVGLEDEISAEAILNEAYSKAPKEWMRESTEKQLAKLRLLIKKSPLKFIICSE